MTGAFDELAWPAERLGDAMRAAAKHAGLSVRDVSPLSGSDDLEDSVSEHAAWLGLEAEPCRAPAGDVEAMLRTAAPALVRVPGPGPGRVLALVPARFGGSRVVDPEGRVRRVPSSALRDLLCGELEEKVAGEVSAIVLAARVPERRQARARRAILAERLSGAPIGGVYLLRPRAAAPLRAQLAHARIPVRVARLLAAHLVERLLFVASFWILGATALAGNVDAGWLVAWGLVLASQIPIHTHATRVQAAIGIDVGAILKRHLLAGALKQDADEARTEGAGRILGRVLEAQAVEDAVIGPGFSVALASTELCVGAAVLATGAEPGLELLLLAAFVVAAGILGFRLFRARAAWTGERLALTHGTIERMVGHRTRLAQQPEEAWHEEEDSTLARMQIRARAMDRLDAVLARGLPRGWLVASLAALAPSLLAGPRGVAALAVTLGGALVVRRALQRASEGVSGLAGAAVSLRSLRPIFAAAALPETLPSPVARGLVTKKTDRADVSLDARHVGFQHRGRAAPVLRDLSLSVRAGDHVLVEGPSGCGKSTLAAILGGLRSAHSGLVLLGGLDRATLGDAAWRACVAGVPQFHENHILGASLAFNLLMGRAWPPTARDLEEAEAVCRELSLGPLLARMPGGIQQPVGETGWQLSHGERSRVYVARALLQGAHVLVLDESFAALDPGTLGKVAACVAARAGASIVIAHP